MTHCKESLTYHNVNFPLARMGAGIDRRVGNRIVGGSGGNVLPTITSMPYDSAVNCAAQLLYFIGIDVDMTYGDSASSANSNKALNLLRNLGFTVRHLSFVPYDLLDVCNYIQSGNIIYVKGENLHGEGKRHAWVIDGMGYCVDPETNEITDRYVNCLWGWGGSCDGFYYGDIFHPNPDYYFVDVEYFAIDKFDFTVI